MARLPYVDLTTAPPETTETWERVRVARGTVRMPPNLYRMLVHNPTVMAAWSAFGQSVRGFGPEGTLVEGAVSLDVRTRELAILAVCAATNADYEWSLHARKGPHIGITSAEVDAIARGEFGSFRMDEVAVLTYARDLSLLHVDTLAATVTELKKHFGDRAIVELTATIGFYNCVVRMLIGLDVDIEPGFEAFRLPERPKMGGAA